ncbi:hypothetical protein CEXT_337401 [Caerostris extrusa]|uniref:Uncharacterized protein n=1 Tax=Caerostris extrusa TaxID=172846 RepID=A0AAV4N3N7_CAEEX|nr:hypothetical protein CEXT_337401 [Caerostris extrusa]
MNAGEVASINRIRLLCGANEVMGSTLMSWMWSLVQVDHMEMVGFFSIAETRDENKIFVLNNKYINGTVLTVVNLNFPQHQQSNDFTHPDRRERTNTSQLLLNAGVGKLYTTKTSHQHTKRQYMPSIESATAQSNPLLSKLDWRQEILEEILREVPQGSHNSGVKLCTTLIFDKGPDVIASRRFSWVQSVSFLMGVMSR